MKAISVSLILVLALFLAAVQAATPSSASSNDNQITQQIRQLNTEEVNALMANNAKTLARLWSDDFVVTNPFNKFLTKPQVLSFVGADKIAFKAYNRQIDYLHVYGNMVVVAGTEIVAWSGHMSLAGKTSELRFTSVWIKQDSRWQEVARHANIVSTK
ncbi:MAG: nuclear transport factor 2 family protein [Gammaproteobacteria bacterium]